MKPNSPKKKHRFPVLTCKHWHGEDNNAPTTTQVASGSSKRRADEAITTDPDGPEPPSTKRRRRSGTLPAGGAPSTSGLTEAGGEKSKGRNQTTRDEAKKTVCFSRISEDDIIRLGVEKQYLLLDAQEFDQIVKSLLTPDEDCLEDGRSSKQKELIQDLERYWYSVADGANSVLDDIHTIFEAMDGPNKEAQTRVLVDFFILKLATFGMQHKIPFKIFPELIISRAPQQQGSEGKVVGIRYRGKKTFLSGNADYVGRAEAIVDARAQSGHQDTPTYGLGGATRQVYEVKKSSGVPVDHMVNQGVAEGLACMSLERDPNDLADEFQPLITSTGRLWVFGLIKGSAHGDSTRRVNCIIPLKLDPSLYHTNKARFKEVTKQIFLTLAAWTFSNGEKIDKKLERSLQNESVKTTKDIKEVWLEL